jgi:hypothetical protein
MPQLTLAPINNRNLFSNHFLQHILPGLPEWARDEHVNVFKAIRQVYDREKVFMTSEMKESQLEERYFRPIFKLLGLEYEVQEEADRGTGDFPDYAFFGSRSELDEATKNKGTMGFYKKALAVGEVKRWNTKLDQFGRDRYNKRRNPSFQMWLHLQQTKVDWGILSDGWKWRLYHRDKPLDTFYEIDLVSVLEGNDLDSFRSFYYFFSKNAFLPRADGTIFLERVLAGSEDYAREVGENLKESVYRALRILSQGFFDRPENHLDPNNSDHLVLVQQNVMRLLYRFLFILYAEGKGLLSEQSYYESPYSLYGLKHEIARKKRAGEAIVTAGTSYWARLKDLFKLIDVGSEALGISRSQFYVPPYNGSLFNSTRNQFLEDKAIGDQALADAIDLLARAPIEERTTGFVDYSTLEIRHLGSIYEGLLEYRIHVAKERMVAIGEKLLWAPYETYAKGRKRPRAFELFPSENRVVPGRIYIGTHRGERRLTGSYYTPEFIVKYIVENALVPVVEEKWNDAVNRKGSLRDAILSTTVLDPAMGSGHFLVGATEFLAAKLLSALEADVESGKIDEAETARWTMPWAKREIVSHCIFGVDNNELAVELAKVSLWLYTISKDRPLSFLDHHLKCGNSLIGSKLVDLAWLPKERPKDTIGPIDKPLGLVQKIIEGLRELEAIPDETVNEVKRKEKLFGELTRSSSYRDMKALADIHTGLYFTEPGLNEIRKSYQELVNTVYYGNAQNIQKKLETVTWAKLAASESEKRLAFHWELEFPEAFLPTVGKNGQAGFDAVIGNPPYVSALELTRGGDPLEREYIKKNFDSAKGAYDQYIPFLELGTKLTHSNGRSSLITPNKFLSAPYGLQFRDYVIRHVALQLVLDVSQFPVFEDPSVYPIVTVIQRRRQTEQDQVVVETLSDTKQPVEKGRFPASFLTAFPENLWSFLLARNVKMILRIATNCQELGDEGVSEVQASTTAGQAEEFSKFLFDCTGEHEKHFQVVNTGLIDRYASKWGYAKLTHQGKTYQKPCIFRNEPMISDSRRKLYGTPKLIVSKVAYVPEVCFDQKGNMAGVNVNVIYDSKCDLRFLLAVLNSRLMAEIYREYFGALTMSGAYAQFQAPQLKILPIPRIEMTASKAYRLNHTEIIDAHLLKYAKNHDESELTSVMQRLADTKENQFAIVHDLACRLVDRLIALHSVTLSTFSRFKTDLRGILNTEEVGSLERLYTPPRAPDPDDATDEGDLKEKIASYKKKMTVAEQLLGSDLSKTTIYLSDFHLLDQLQTETLVKQRLTRIHNLSDLLDVFRKYRDEFAIHVNRAVFHGFREISDQMDALETCIDLLVYTIYKVTPAEAALIENTTIGKVQAKYGWD